MPRTFYGLRRVMLIGACVLPVAALGAAYWFVTAVWLAPAVPDQTTPAAEVVQYMAHEKGLAGLAGPRAVDFVLAQARRVARDASFRDAFLAAVRTSSADDKRILRRAMLNAFKPLVLGDAQRYEALAADQREAFLDDCIVKYNRMNVFRGEQVHIKSVEIWGGEGGPDRTEVLDWLMNSLSERERASLGAYAAALRARVALILDDPELTAKIEARIAGE